MVGDRRTRLAADEGVVDDGERDDDERGARGRGLAPGAYDGSLENSGHAPTMPGRGARVIRCGPRSRSVAARRIRRAP
jgi:hypothetical protein